MSGHRAQEGQGRQALNALFVNVTSSRVDVTDRNVVIATVPRDSSARVHNVSGSRSPRSRAGTFATFVGLTDPAGKPLRNGFADPRTCARRSSACSPT